MLHIELADEGGYLPGTTLSGHVRWSVGHEVDTAELSLFWYTSGKGTRDVGVIERLRFDQPRREDRREFRLALPREPYSFSGALISLVWAIELVLTPGEEAERKEFVLSPSRNEIVLPQEKV